MAAVRQLLCGKGCQAWLLVMPGSCHVSLGAGWHGSKNLLCAVALLSALLTLLRAKTFCCLFQGPQAVGISVCILMGYLSILS
jgi:hypothetical protein